MRLLRRRCVARPVLYYTGIALLLCAGILYSFTAFNKGFQYWTTGVWSQHRSETIINQTKNLVTRSSDVLIPNSFPKPRLYFETDASYKERLELESNIQYSAMLKKLDKPYFDKREGYNESYVDSLPLLRNIPDYRPPGCENITYPTSNTTVSVILNYHNEVLSLLLRSIYTILAAIPPHNLCEVILVDDASNFTSYPDLERVEPLVSQFTVTVRYFRFETNKGLIYSRVFAAKKARGDTLLVLDSHVEMRKGFLEPLLQSSDRNYRAIVAPVFDFIETFKMIHWNYDGHGLGYDAYLNWVWVVNGTTGTEPWQMPGILGGAYLMTKRRMEELDYFGKGLVGWGGENIDISLKNIMCGGEIWGVPCSRCLHFAASRKPQFHGDRVRASETNNDVTVAKSYLNDHQFEEFLKGRPGYTEKLADKRAVAENQKLLQDLKCDRDWEWVRDHLMDPFIESFSSKSNIAVGLMFGEKCIKVVGEDVFKLHSCDSSQPFVNQLRLSIRFELRWGKQKCFDIGWTPPRLSSCHRQEGHQKFHYSILTKQLSNKAQDSCLTINPENATLAFKKCAQNSPDQKLYFKTIYLSNLIP